MPKELTHFFMAEKTAAALRETRLGRAASRHPNALLYGSVYPDILYYSAQELPGGLHGIPNRLHGKGHPIDVVRLQAGLAKELPDNTIRQALLLGIICHISLDATIHPLVGYLTEGSATRSPKRRTQATQRHRALESLMDMVVCPERIGATRYSLETIGGATGKRFIPELPMHALAAEANTSQAITTQAHRSSWKSYARLQKLCSSRILSRICYALAPALPDKAREIILLLYAPQLQNHSPLLGGTIEFQHPESGEVFNKTLNELLQDAVTTAVRTADQVETFLNGGAFPERLPNPHAGVHGDLKHFGSPPVPQLF